ncbi:MAG: hypothetical protein EBS91_10020, partial [Betaproteobacteria bacterium]|nr:hypothetical protein [Betaproteobacteria bacterium]
TQIKPVMGVQAFSQVVLRAATVIQVVMLKTVLVCLGLDAIQERAEVERAVPAAMDTTMDHIITVYMAWAVLVLPLPCLMPYRLVNSVAEITTLLEEAVPLIME